MLMRYLMSLLGKLYPSKTDEFSEKFQEGGVIFNPKIYVAKFMLQNLDL